MYKIGGGILSNNQRGGFGKTIFIITGVTVAVIFGFVMLLMIPITMIPTAEAAFVEQYKEITSYTGIDWADMLVYDTVRYENDFSKVEPEETAYKFLKIKLQRYKLEDV